MAQLVLIAKPTESLVNTIGDIVAIHEDDVGLSGSGYEGFEILLIENLTAAEVRAKLGALVPQIRADEQGQKEIFHEGQWKPCADPKYRQNLAALTGSDKESLSSGSMSAGSIEAILEEKTVHNFRLV